MVIWYYAGFYQIRSRYTVQIFVDTPIQFCPDGNRPAIGGPVAGRCAAFQGGDPLFNDLLGGIGAKAVNITGIRQAKTGRRMGAVAEHMGACGANGI